MRKHFLCWLTVLSFTLCSRLDAANSVVVDPSRCEELANKIFDECQLLGTAEAACAARRQAFLERCLKAADPPPPSPDICLGPAGFKHSKLSGNAKKRVAPTLKPVGMFSERR